MCGIVGVQSHDDGCVVADVVLGGLSRLEYRGYDSAGMASLDADIHLCRAQGKLKNLQQRLQHRTMPGSVGIGHTRWATHGDPDERNAHPHTVEGVAVVHNGIIENHADLRAGLEAAGYRFLSDTDSEVIPVLIRQALDTGMEPEQAIRHALDQLHGSFALGIMLRVMPNVLYAARRSSPLLLGRSEQGVFMASDLLAMNDEVDRTVELYDDDMACLDGDGIRVIDAHGRLQVRPEQRVHAARSGVTLGKGCYRHFMLKEIHEQPQVIHDTLQAMDTAVSVQALNSLNTLSPREPLHIVACGTSFYAGKIAAYWLEQWAGQSISLRLASEFRYNPPPLYEGGQMICLSQSGETADTMAALLYAKSRQQKVLSIINVAGSSMDRQSDVSLITEAGPEIGVASTKAFTTQLVVLMRLALHLARQRQSRATATLDKHERALQQAPAMIQRLLQDTTPIAAMAAAMQQARSALYLGRGICFPLAMEAALKLKEISYIHAEAYAAGELKHGPIALVDQHLPVIVIAPPGPLFEKTASNLCEVHARHGRIFLFSDQVGCQRLQDKVEQAVVMPDVPATLVPLVYAVAVQLLAYHVALEKGTDIDQPRNLAKSVTVE